MWTAETGEGEVHWLVFNLSDEPRQMSINLTDAGFRKSENFTAVDIWSNNQKQVSEFFEMMPAPPESVLIKATAR